MRTLIVTVLMIGSIVAAEATVLVPATLADLSRDARTIARGTVIAVESRWAGDRRAIETLVTLQVEQYLKGPLGETVQFRVPGGQIGRYRSVTIGAPAFASGQRVVVFLGARGPSIPHVLGLNQGVFRLTAGRNGPMVARPIISLADFERQVRGLAGEVR